MAPVLRLLALDLAQFRSLLGSGEEKFCAKVLKGIPAAAEQRGLVKEWKRGVTGLLLGQPGEAMSERSPFEKGTTAEPGLSLAFASVIEAFAQEGLGGSLPISRSLRDELLQRPLFGLDGDGDLVRWGALSRDELADLPEHPLLAPIRARSLDVVGLSGSAWTD